MTKPQKANASEARRLLDPAVYEDAAMLLCSTRVSWFKYSCNAIVHEADCSGDYLRFYRKIFKPKRRKLGETWYGFTWDEQNQLARSLALLFMAEIVEEEQ